MGPPDISGSGRGQYVTDTNEALDIKLVRTTADIESDSTTFHPEMSHQVYGDSESVYGYTGLKIQLYYSAARLTTYAGFTFKAQVSSECPTNGAGDGDEEVRADPVLEPLAEWLQRPFCTNLSEFSRLLQDDAQFNPPGEKVHQFIGRRLAQEPDTPRTFEVFSAGVDTPGLRDFHERLQTFLLWYIDAASYIDTDDSHWRFFLCFERYRGDASGEECVAIAGYATVYDYYAYPNHVRPRISQFLVLPPFRGRGIATQLLQSIYNTYETRDDVVDITVEDPSEEFARVRDALDCVRCRRLVEFAPARLTSASSTTTEGFSGEMKIVAQRRLKLCAAQSRRVYEILRLGATDITQSEARRAYRLDVKRRLYQPYHKEDGQMKKLERVMRPAELALSVTSREQRHEQLERLYQQLEACYLRTIKTLALIE